MNVGTDPRVDVLTPCLNSARFIGDALGSVERLSGIDATHIVMDGGSDDGTIAALESSSGIIWRSERDKGQSDALNKASALAASPWIGWLNADEFYLPDGVADLLSTGERTGADVVFGDALIVDEEGRFLRLLPQHPFSKRILEWYGPFPSTCSTLFRRAVLGGSPWDPSLKAVMDWGLHLHLLRRDALFLYVPTIVAAFRYHPDRATLRHAGLIRGERERLRRKHKLASFPLVDQTGRGLHAWAKLRSGGYLRQFKARRFRGCDMRWFDDAEADARVRALSEVLYD